MTTERLSGSGKPIQKMIFKLKVVLISSIAAAGDAAEQLSLNFATANLIYQNKES